MQLITCKYLTIIYIMRVSRCYKVPHGLAEFTPLWHTNQGDSAPLRGLGEDRPKMEGWDNLSAPNGPLGHSGGSRVLSSGLEGLARPPQRRRIGEPGRLVHKLRRRPGKPSAATAIGSLPRRESSPESGSPGARIPRGAAAARCRVRVSGRGAEAPGLSPLACSSAVERRPVKPVVAGSIPAAPAIPCRIR